MKFNSKQILKEDEVDLKDLLDVKESLGSIEDQACDLYYDEIMKKYKVNEDDIENIGINLSISVESIGKEEGNIKTEVDEDGEEVIVEDKRPITLQVNVSVDLYKNDMQEIDKSLLNEDSAKSSNISKPKDVFPFLDKIIVEFNQKILDALKSIYQK